MTLIKRGSKALAVIVVVLAVSGFAGHQYVNHVEKQRPIVTLAKHSDKVLFFYR
ncbi:thioredoxin, partial [Lactiplantibacillus plantarum]|nr:thioredoxin [Lactiplantibacillus plantarum]